MPDRFPDAVRPTDLRDLDGCVDALFDFCLAALRAVAPVAAVVKFQSAYFERYFSEGVAAYYSLIHEAKQMGLLVIGDVKRGDIGATSAAYAAAHLADVQFDDIDDFATPDAITVNPFLGPDTLDPFLGVCRDEGKGLFVLVRTSNPGSVALQDVVTQDGRTVSEMVADFLTPLAQGPGLMGASGWSNVGAVVGATQPHTMASLRRRLPRSIFLLPGYGTQGATAEMTRAAFTDGQGAIVSASRSVLYPKHHPGESWQEAIARAARAMRDDLAHVTGAGAG